MKTCLFLSFKSRTEPTVDEIAKIDGILRTTPRLAKALIHTPSATHDPYVKDEPPPSLVLQLYFAELSDLESAVSRTGTLFDLSARTDLPAIAGGGAAQQAMVVRSFAVPEPAFRTAPGEPHCTYLVSYEGEADDLNAWHTHYLESHIGYMAMFPDIRELEVYTRLDWVSALPWPRFNFMQRNKVVFDSAEALDHALNSQVRHEMRADFKTFPRFAGLNRHYAMATRVVSAP